MKHVVIVGTGLIGASFGLALRKAGYSGAITGVSSPRAAADALAAGAIDRAASLAEAAPQADLIFLSQTIGRILDTIRHLDPLLAPGALVTDAGSTKCQIVDLARHCITRAQFLGGHPMAGKETRGASSAEADIFRNRTWVLTPDSAAELTTAVVREFRGWLDKIGARILTLDSDEHDRVVSLTSHLAQLASTALAATVADRLGATPREQVAGPGLEDMTRLARGSYEIWRDILATNSDHIDHALSFYIQKLEHLRENLRTRQLQEEFERAAALAGRLRKPRS
ncbi:MAG TPA: prephenate dehydrogenase [Candidatus Solibacter sp.]|nr:prephenate dehydrogenase [Candidatus Solibacter sp.]